MQLLFDDGDQHIGRNCAPDLRLHSVLAGAQEFLDAQMLLDPLEEQLYLPTAPVQRGNGQWRQAGIVGQKHQRLAGFRVVEADAPLVAACAFVLQVIGIPLRDVKAIQCNGRIADHSGGSVGGSGVHPPGIEIALGAGHKERARLMQSVQSSEIQTGWPRAIATIHDIEGACFDRQNIQHVDVVQLAIADVNEGPDGAAQVQQRVQLDRRLGRTNGPRPATRRPVEQTQAQVDGGGVQRVDSRVELDAQRIVGVQRTGAHNQARGQFVTGWPRAIDAPVALIQRLPQRRARGDCLQFHVIQLALIGDQARFDVSQRFAPRQLRERHDAKYIATVQGAHSCIARVAFDDSPERLPSHVLHQLRKWP